MRQVGDWNYVGLVEKMETISPKSKSIAQPLTKNDLQKIVLAIFRKVPAGVGMSSVTPFYTALLPWTHLAVGWCCHQN